MITGRNKKRGNLIGWVIRDVKRWGKWGMWWWVKVMILRWGRGWWVVGLRGVKHLQEIVEDVNSYFHRLLNHPALNKTIVAIIAVATTATAIVGFGRVRLDTSASIGM